MKYILLTTSSDVDMDVVRTQSDIDATGLPLGTVYLNFHVGGRLMGTESVYPVIETGSFLIPYIPFNSKTDDVERLMISGITDWFYANLPAPGDTLLGVLLNITPDYVKA